MLHLKTHTVMIGVVIIWAFNVLQPPKHSLLQQASEHQQDWRETIKEPSNIQRVARNQTFWRLKSVTSRQKLRICLLTSHWKAVRKLWASKTMQRLYALQPKQKRATKTLCNCRRCMLNSLELNLEFKLALLPACCPKPPSPMPPTTNISLPSKYCIS